MSIEHEHVNPRIDALLRQIVAANDLQPEQNQRVRARLGLAPTQASEQSTLTLPASQPGPIRAPEQEAIPMIATTRTRLRQQWLQFALAAVAFIAAGVVLALIFGSGSDDPKSQPGIGGPPEATATAAATPTAPPAPATATTGSQDPSALPTPDEMGMYRAITLEQAQAIVPFEIVVPEDVPGWKVPPVVTVFDLPIVRNGFQPYRVEMWFELSSDESPETSILTSVQFTQLSLNSTGPNMPEAETTTTVINGIDVNLTTGVNGGGDPLLAYWWTNNDISYQLLALPKGDLTPERVEALMQAILATATDGYQEPTVLPTPDAMGMYPGITLELAQTIVPFEIVVPEPVPNGLDAPFITVIEAPQVSGEPNYRVELSFGLTGDESPAQSVQFVQRASPPPMTEVPEGATPLGTFNGIEVFQRSEPNAAGDPLITYQWQHNDVGYLLVGRTVGGLTPELLDDLLQAIFVQFTPTAESESARLEQERAELMPFPVPNTCAVTGWAGPDFRVGQQYASAYFLDGDGLTLGTTHGLLFVGENQISWFADAPLTTSEALSGPATIRALQPGDASTVEIPIEVIEQISGGGKDPLVERAWWSTVSFPSEGCWEISVSLGGHVLDATVYVYARQ